MRDPARELQKLVALKRQRAEQRVQALQVELDAERARLAQAEANLRAVDDPGLDFAARSLSLQQGRVDGLIASVKARQGDVSAAEARLVEAREALKWVMYSEDRLDDLTD
jgi:predicted  nucleic acid-binding Zn-ribbon protein